MYSTNIYKKFQGIQLGWKSGKSLDFFWYIIVWNLPEKTVLGLLNPNFGHGKICFFSWKVMEIMGFGWQNNLDTLNFIFCWSLETNNSSFQLYSHQFCYLTSYDKLRKTQFTTKNFFSCQKLFIFALKKRSKKIKINSKEILSLILMKMLLRNLNLSPKFQNFLIINHNKRFLRVSEFCLFWSLYRQSDSRSARDSNRW